MHDILPQLLSHLRAIWQRRWHALVAAWVICVAGWIGVYFWPDRYEAAARVYVDTQSVLKPLLSGLAVQPNVDQQVAMMSRTLISRPNIERVVRMADLDLRAKTTEDKEELADRLAAQLDVKSVGRDNLYTITYRDKNPEDAKKVVQSLLTIFVEGSLGDKRKDADSARRFIDEQIKTYEQKLVLAENNLKEFKRQHAGMMPGEGKDYYAKLSDAATTLNQARLELREAEQARDALKMQLESEIPDLAPEPDAEQVASPEIDSRIQALRQRLDGMRLSYTEQHPDIVATKRIIEQLEEQKKQEAGLKKVSPRAAQNQNPVFQQIRVSLAEAEATVASMKARVAEYGARYGQLKASADALPQVEADFTQLNRDYEVNKENYEKLLARRESAQISGDMEANTGVMDFRVVDPPRVPLVPSSPNRPVLMSLVLAVGLLGGVAVAFLLGQARPTFNDRRGLREATGLPLLGSVSMIWTDSQKRRRKKGLIAFFAALSSLIGAYSAIMAILFLTGRAA